MSKEVSYMEAIKIIKNAIDSGINLKIKDKRKSEKYLLSLCKFVRNKDNYLVSYDDPYITIESKEWDPILMVGICDGILHFINIDHEASFSAFMEVIEFMVSKHDIDTKKEKKLKKKYEPKDEDFEWI